MEGAAIGRHLGSVLGAIAAGLLRAAGFRAVVIDLRRPEWDDFEVVVSLGDEDDAYEARARRLPACRGLSGRYRFDAAGSRRSRDPDVPEPAAPAAASRAGLR